MIACHPVQWITGEFFGVRLKWSTNIWDMENPGRSTIMGDFPSGFISAGCRGFMVFHLQSRSMHAFLYINRPFNMREWRILWRILSILSAIPLFEWIFTEFPVYKASTRCWILGFQVSETRDRSLAKRAKRGWARQVEWSDLVRSNNFACHKGLLRMPMFVELQSWVVQLL